MQTLPPPAPPAPAKKAWYKRKAVIRARIEVPKLWLQYYLVGIRRTVRRALWNAASKIPGRSLGVTLRELTIPTSSTPGALVGRGDQQFVLPVVLACDERVIVEPKYGWAIGAPARLLDLSLTYGWTTSTWSGRETVGLPPLRRVMGARRDPLVLERALAATSLWPLNYYHFVMDVLPKLVSFKRAGIDITTLPVIVTPDLATTAFFREARALGELAEIDFVIEPSRCIQVDNITFAHHHTLDISMVKEMCDLVSSDGQPLHRLTSPARIFIDRSPSVGRNLENASEIIDLLASFGFQRFDTADMPFVEQIELFASAERVVAIHGAALANLVWCDLARVDVLELFPPVGDDEFTSFVTLCSDLDIPYRRLVGEPQPYAHKRASFRLDAGLLAAELQRREDVD